ncbi:MAG: RNA polymerase sigma factor [Salibacteraceae bacterium]
MKLIYRKETKDLVKGCKAGNAECQRQLYERYVDKMYMVCMRYARDEMEAQDMLQDGFVRVFYNFITF